MKLSRDYLVSRTDPQYFSYCFLESRCDKDLDTLSGYALCLPNLARLQTYHFVDHRPILCVEIKVSFVKGKVIWGEERGGFRLYIHGTCLECTLPQKLLVFLTLGPTAPRRSPALRDSACFLLLPCVPPGFFYQPDLRDMAPQTPRFRLIPRCFDGEPARDKPCPGFRPPCFLWRVQLSSHPDLPCHVLLATWWHCMLCSRKLAWGLPLTLGGTLFFCFCPTQ